MKMKIVESLKPICVICGEKNLELYYNDTEVRCLKCIPTGHNVETRNETFEVKKPEALH
jgi:hypothetical protein